MGSVDWMLLRGIVRGLQMVGSFVTFGTLFLAATLLYREYLPGLRPIAWTGLAAALAFGVAWFLLQTADFASASSFSDVVAALPIVADNTRFGELLIGRCGALLLATLCFQVGWPRLAALIAFGAIVAESWLGHGGAMTGTIGTILLITSIVHLSSGAMWLGALPALRLAIKRLPVNAAAIVARRFSPIGIACVMSLVVSAAIQYWLLIGRPAALFTTGYGFVAFVKILLLVGLVILAAINRERLTPKLPLTRPWLLRSINAELVLGLLVLVAAGVILQLEPPTMAHMAMGQ
jgi:copper resistance protein D